MSNTEIVFPAVLSTQTLPSAATAVPNPGPTDKSYRGLTAQGRTARSRGHNGAAGDATTPAARSRPPARRSVREQAQARHLQRPVAAARNLAALRPISCYIGAVRCGA